MLAALEELYARKPEHQMRPRLEPTRLACEMLGNPQKNYPIIHITGTNGKTSTARMIERILRELGLKTGRMTSPHLVRFNERISLDGSPIDDERFLETYGETKPLLELVDARLAQQGEQPLTFFEAMTAIAFQIFSDAPVDVLVLEVGIGGEWDSTNVADGDVSVFTAIDLDHTKVLGDKVEEIAVTKSGIIKDKSIVVSSPQLPSVIEILRNKTSQEIFVAGESFSLLSVSAEGMGTRFSVRGSAGNYPDLWMPIIGSHQAENAATAIVAVEQFLGGRTIADEYLRMAMADVVSPGRLQVVSKEPLIILDGAHNPAGLRSLQSAMSEHFQDVERIGLVALLSDKDVDTLAKQFAELFPAVVVTEVSGPRSFSAQELSAKITSHGGNVLGSFDSVAKAFQEARFMAEQADSALFVTGSLYLIGAVLAELQKDDDEEQVD
jgi:dihydrofolate synthase/folylpolyglutamate synthase